MQAKAVILAVNPLEGMFGSTFFATKRTKSSFRERDN